jgi:CheY-like chemotaxis protein
MISGPKKEVTILIAEDDDGHAELIKDNLQESGVTNPIIRLKDGQAALDFLFGSADNGTPVRQNDHPYLMLLDIRMPKVDGIEVLRRIKADPELRKMPVIMLTTTEDPREIQNCYDLGCSIYVTKPVDYLKFSEMLTRIGLFIMVVQVPQLSGE